MNETLAELNERVTGWLEVGSSANAAKILTHEYCAHEGIWTACIDCIEAFGVAVRNAALEEAAEAAGKDCASPVCAEGYETGWCGLHDIAHDIRALKSETP